MRQIILDTETTGLSPAAGNRIIEIGCVELRNRRLTGNNFHRYINPERDSEEGALAVHGLTRDFLGDKPKFAEISREFLEYVAGAEIIIHNAPFDLAFLDAEFERLGLPRFVEHVGEIIDTLVQAKQLHPGKRNSLDSLCDRYEISNAHRTLHGALLDAELLADVYINLTRGQDALLIIDDAQDSAGGANFVQIDLRSFALPVLPASEQEAAAHEEVLAQIDKASGGKTIWRNCEGLQKAMP